MAKIKFAKKIGPKQIIGVIAIVLLIANLVLFSFRVLSSFVFWIALLVIWGAAYLCFRLLKEK
ncbi:MAG: hypothetical protein Q8O89_06905 [Nanoarchaeota archaeon]|nr:hypothetical protein [Nanoarchaeota archaeon]